MKRALIAVLAFLLVAAPADAQIGTGQAGTTDNNKFGVKVLCEDGNGRLYVWPTGSDGVPLVHEQYQGHPYLGTLFAGTLPSHVMVRCNPVSIAGLSNFTLIFAPAIADSESCAVAMWAVVKETANPADGVDALIPSVQPVVGDTTASALGDHVTGWYVGTNATYYHADVARYMVKVGGSRNPSVITGGTASQPWYLSKARAFQYAIQLPSWVRGPYLGLWLENLSGSDKNYNVDVAAAGNN